MALKIFEERRKNILLSQLLRGLLYLMAIGMVAFIATYTQDMLFTMIAFFYAVFNLATGYWRLRNMPEDLEGWKARKDVPEEKQLLNIVEELKLAASYKGKIDVYVIPDYTINAFAYTLGEKAVIGVNKGALERLNRAETSALVGHELSHIINRDSDVKVSTFLILIFLGALADFGVKMLRAIAYSRSRDRGKVFFAILPLVIVSYAVLILGEIIFYALLRRRESLADVEGVRLTRDKEGMLSLLNKLKEEEKMVESEGFLNKFLTKTDVKASLYFWNISGLFSSHPPLDERIERIKQL